MDEKAIKALIEQVDQSSIREFDLTVDGVHLYLSKNKTANHSVPATVDTSQLKASDTPVSAADNAAQAVEEVPTTTAAESEDNLQTIKSPLVGVAYLQPNPEAQSYVKVGDQVKVGDVVCVIEAMKMMTEIKSQVAGQIAEILIDNESMVDYDQPLIKVKTEVGK
ncbi:acetyl-CoA carboxylase biotin carboxyl carrier protein [Oenococcus sp.]|uniref:acetyl-CoA carboxylase biotin carboxyl carrier protein n=1 Tax=Oenococcus sp. TaxID=1979414 RepID=UPI0039E9FA78